MLSANTFCISLFLVFLSLEGMLLPWLRAAGGAGLLSALRLLAGWEFGCPPAAASKAAFFAAWPPTTRSLMRSAYLSVLIVWSAEEAAGETAAIMTVRERLLVKESFSTRVSLDARYGT